MHEPRVRNEADDGKIRPEYSRVNKDVMVCRIGAKKNRLSDIWILSSAFADLESFETACELTADYKELKRMWRKAKGKLLQCNEHMPEVDVQ